jgi:hypothetical protein
MYTQDFLPNEVNFLKEERMKDEIRSKESQEDSKKESKTYDKHHIPH